MQSALYNEQNARPSVRLSNACIVTKRKKRVPTFLYRIKDPSFTTRRMVGGGDPFYLKFFVKVTPFERKRQSIFARGACKKSSVITNRKFTTRFPMSLG